MEVLPDRLRAAHAAVAERDRLVRRKRELEREVAAAEASVAELQRLAAEEQKDVRRYEGGLWAMLYDVFSDRSARLTNEQREAAAAQMQLDEAVSLGKRLAEKRAETDARLTALADADAELEAARAAAGHPAGSPVDEAARQQGAADDERQQIDEAIAAGERAHATVARLAGMLGMVRCWDTVDPPPPTFQGLAEHNQVHDAHEVAGHARGELSCFALELEDIGLTLDLQLTKLETASAIHALLAKRLEQLRARRAALTP